jgi:Allophanate hydrolase subunit 2
MSLIVERAGFLTSVQDLGRMGFRQFGVSLGGALDSFGLRVTNLLVGNDEGAAGLEITLGDLLLRFEDERVVAWCGAEFDVQIASNRLSAGHAAHVRAGERLQFGRPQIGCRCWLAVSGGIDVPSTLGSRSTDLRAGFGGCQGRALRDGDQLPLGKISAAADRRRRKNFHVDGTARLGESGKAQADLAFHSRRRLGSLPFNPSTFHERSIRRFTRFRSHGRAS